MIWCTFHLCRVLRSQTRWKYDQYPTSAVSVAATDECSLEEGSGVGVSGGGGRKTRVRGAGGFDFGTALLITCCFPLVHNSVWLIEDYQKLKHNVNTSACNQCREIKIFIPRWSAGATGFGFSVRKTARRKTGLITTIQVRGCQCSVILKLWRASSGRINRRYV